MRRLSVLLRHLPPDAALHRIQRDGRPYWTPEAHLLDDIRRLIDRDRSGKAGKPHPDRARPTRRARDADTPGRRDRIARARARAHARRRAIDAGEIT